MNADLVALSLNWHLLTRLGEIQILLPFAILTFYLLHRGAPQSLRAMVWSAGLLLATALTLASKVGFIGWALGSPSLNFTGVSGHAMFSAAIYPALACALAGAAPRSPGTLRWLPLGLGLGLATAIAISRVEVGAHSPSEVVVGLLLGSTVSASLLLDTVPQRAPRSAWPPLVALLWLALGPTHAPVFETHPLVTRIALALSGRNAPFTRHEMLNQVRRP